MNKLIELKNVWVIKNKIPILKNVNWEVLENESWAIIGRNGSGKSFLLRLISANLFPSSGTITIFNEEFGNVNLWELKKKIGFVSDLLQKDYNEYSKAIDVIYSGFFSSNGLFEEITPQMKEKTNEILQFLEIEKFTDRIFGELSHGEQRKILIARAMVFDPVLLVFDEPCTGLDIAAREEFLITVEKLIENGHHIIFVTHHIDEIINSINKVLFLKDGEIYKTGNKKELMNIKNLEEVLEYKLKIKKKKGRYWPIFH
jgi:iron complex transport system ATP-binding protein